MVVRMIPEPRDSSYDKIFKENIESLILPLALKVLGIPEPAELMEVPDDVQYTIERKPDFLKLVLDADGKELFVLQLECQTSDEPGMLYRMLIYRALLLNRHRLPVRQFVFYLGNQPAKMPRELVQEDLTFRYSVRNVIDIPYTTFLDTEKPEEIVLAILGNLSGESPQQVIRNVLRALRATVEEPLRLEKFMRQLEVLSKLRNIQEETIKQISEMPLRYDLETDIRYLQGKAKGIEEASVDLLVKGMERGREEGISLGRQEGRHEGREEGINLGRQEGRQEGYSEAQRQAVEGLLQLGILTVSQIATALNVSPGVVESVQAGMGGSTPS